MEHDIDKLQEIRKELSLMLEQNEKNMSLAIKAMPFVGHSRRHENTDIIIAIAAVALKLEEAMKLIEEEIRHYS